MSFPSFRKDLSIPDPDLLKAARGAFERIPDKAGCDIPLADHLMSGLAMFGLKYPSLLQFDRDSRNGGVQADNLQTLYGINRPPSDIGFRERLDGIDPQKEGQKEEQKEEDTQTLEALFGAERRGRVRRHQGRARLSRSLLLAVAIHKDKPTLAPPCHRRPSAR